MKRRAALNVFILTGGSESEGGGWGRWGGGVAGGDRNGQMIEEMKKRSISGMDIPSSTQKQNWKSSCSPMQTSLRLH